MSLPPPLRVCELHADSHILPLLCTSEPYLGGGPSSGVIWSGWNGWRPSFWLLPLRVSGETAAEGRMVKEQPGPAALSRMAGQSLQPASCRGCWGCIASWIHLYSGDVPSRVKPSTQCLSINSVLITSLVFQWLLQISRVRILKLASEFVDKMANILNMQSMSCREYMILTEIIWHKMRVKRASIKSCWPVM